MPNRLTPIPTSAKTMRALVPSTMWKARQRDAPNPKAAVTAPGQFHDHLTISFLRGLAFSVA